MKLEPSPLERAVIGATLAGDDAALAVLRGQWASARVTSREPTGAGLYLRIDVGNDAEPLPNKQRIAFGDVVVDLPGRPDAIGSLLWIEDGRLRTLEMYTFEIAWPGDLSGFVVRYAALPRSFAKLAALSE